MILRTAALLAALSLATPALAQGMAGPAQPSASASGGMSDMSGMKKTDAKAGMKADAMKGGAMKGGAMKADAKGSAMTGPAAGSAMASGSMASGNMAAGGNAMAMTGKKKKPATAMSGAMSAPKP